MRCDVFNETSNSNALPRVVSDWVLYIVWSRSVGQTLVSDEFTMEISSIYDHEHEISLFSRPSQSPLHTRHHWRTIRVFGVESIAGVLTNTVAMVLLLRERVSIMRRRRRRTGG